MKTGWFVDLGSLMVRTLLLNGRTYAQIAIETDLSAVLVARIARKEVMSLNTSTLERIAKLVIAESEQRVIEGAVPRKKDAKKEV